MFSAIKTINLVRVFERGDKTITALDNVSIDVPQGIIYGLLGPNGAGKTTLIRILTTLLLPTSGEAYVLGYDVVKEADKVRKVINLVSGGEYAGYRILTVKENLWFYSQLFGLGIKEGWRKIYELANLLDMHDFLVVRLNRVSTGMAQKYNLARGLLNDPLVLFLDEPTLGLDVGAARAIRKIIREWVDKYRDRTILLTTHYMSEAEELCDLISIIHKGKIIATGTPDELKRMVSHEIIYKLEVRNVPEEKLLTIKENREWIIAISARSEPVTGNVIARFVMRDGDASDIIKLIEKLGGEVVAISKVEPSLEDVFLKLVGESIE